MRANSIPTGAERKSAMVAVFSMLAAGGAFAATTLSSEGEVRALNAALLSRPSATETLARWCADHRLASDAKIVAVKVPGATMPPGAEISALLGDPDPAVIKHRRVDLNCGAHGLSIADNWYRADRLTPDMNSALEETQAPFGVVVKPLGFTRRTVGVWFSPHPARDAIVLRHRAVLSTSAGLPFSVVVERYTYEILADDTSERRP